uniref:Uncharacterized protein n=1 Tax=Anopheles merus TaxID=30066 RepID=A0A182V9K3_ANOME
MYGSSMPLPATEAVSSTSRAIGLTANESQIFLIMSRHSASLAGAIASICTTCSTLWAMNESSPDVGSSHSSRWGSVSVSDANASRFLSPPDSPLMRPGAPMIVSAHLTSDSSCSTSWTRCCFTLAGTSRPMRSIAWNSRCSRVVSDGMNRSSCCTARTAFGEILTPGGDRNASAFSSVVLPAPELPITASSSPLFATPQLRSRVQSGSRGFPSVGASPNTSISFQV